MVHSREERKSNHGIFLRPSVRSSMNIIQFVLMWVYLLCFGPCSSHVLALKATIHTVRTISCGWRSRKGCRRWSSIMFFIMFYPFLSPWCPLYKLKVLLLHIKSTEYIKDNSFKQKHKSIHSIQYILLMVRLSFNTFFIKSDCIFMLFMVSSQLMFQ